MSNGEKMTHEEKLDWMAKYAARWGVDLVLEGEVGFGRECVGILAGHSYPDYHWYDTNYDPADTNGTVWTPKDAYHKHDCVAVLGRGEEAESQLYGWLKWFDDNGFVIERGQLDRDPGNIAALMGDWSYARMVRSHPSTGGGTVKPLGYADIQRRIAELERSGVTLPITNEEIAARQSIEKRRGEPYAEAEWTEAAANLRAFFGLLAELRQQRRP
jgi:hypothetical protein